MYIHVCRYSIYVYRILMDLERPLHTQGHANQTTQGRILVLY